MKITWTLFMVMASRLKFWIAKIHFYPECKIGWIISIFIYAYNQYTERQIIMHMWSSLIKIAGQIDRQRRRPTQNLKSASQIESLPRWPTRNNKSTTYHYYNPYQMTLSLFGDELHLDITSMLFGIDCTTYAHWLS